MRMCKCGRNELPNGFSTCPQCWGETPRYMTHETRTKHTVLTELAKAQNSGDFLAQRKLQAEYDKLRRNAT